MNDNNNSLIMDQLEDCLKDSIDELEKTSAENIELREKLNAYNGYKEFVEKVASSMSSFVENIKEEAPDSSESVENMIKNPEDFFQKLAAEIKTAVHKTPDNIGTISDFNSSSKKQDPFEMLVRDGYEAVLMNEQQLLNR